MHHDSVDSGPVNCCATRESVETVLRQKARRLHDQASNLEKLADQAAHMHGGAEEALWSLVVQLR